MKYLKFKYLALLSLCILAEARNIHKREVESFSGVIKDSDELRTPQKYIIEPVQNLAKASENSVAPPYDAVDFTNGDNSNAIERKNENFNFELGKTSNLNISNASKDTSTANEQPEAEDSENLIQSEVNIAKAIENPTTIPEQIIQKEGNEETLKTESIILVKPLDSLESSTSADIISAPLLEKLKQSVGQDEKSDQTDFEENSYKLVKVEEEKISRNFNDNLQEISVDKSAAEATKFEINAQNEQHIPTNYIDVQEEKINESALEDFTTNSANEPTTRLNPELTTSSTTKQIKENPTTAMPSNSIIASQTATASISPATTTLKPVTEEPREPATNKSDVSVSRSELEGPNLPTVVNTTGTTRRLAPSGTPSTTRRGGLLSKLPSLPSGPLLPILSKNRVNSTKNHTQSNFGFGILAIPLNFKPNIFAPNNNVETRSAHNDAKYLPRDVANWNIHRGLADNKPNKVNNDTKEDNVLVNCSPGFLNFQKFQDRKPDTNIPANAQIVHLYFPLRFPFRGQVLTETGSKERKLPAELKTHADELTPLVFENKSDDIKNTDKSKSDEKSPFMFDFELPKSLLQFVKGFFNAFMPQQN